jgi:hypothetical protein
LTWELFNETNQSEPLSVTGLGIICILGFILHHFEFSRWRHGEPDWWIILSVCLLCISDSVGLDDAIQNGRQRRNLARILHEGNEAQGKYGKQGCSIARRCIAIAMDKRGIDQDWPPDFS